MISGYENVGKIEVIDGANKVGNTSCELEGTEKLYSGSEGVLAYSLSAAMTRPIELVSGSAICPSKSSDIPSVRPHSESGGLSAASEMGSSSDSSS